MADKLLSVKEAKEDLVQHFLVTNTFDTDRMDALISAVRREQDLIATKRVRERAVKILCDCLYMQDLIATKRERERAVALIDFTLKIPFENYLDVQAVKKKILEEK